MHRARHEDRGGESERRAEDRHGAHGSRDQGERERARETEEGEGDDRHGGGHEADDELAAHVVADLGLGGLDDLADRVASLGRQEQDEGAHGDLAFEAPVEGEEEDGEHGEGAAPEEP